MHSETASNFKLRQQADTAFAQGDYAQASELYQQILSGDLAAIDCCWYLGLALLLQGQEETAQIIWMAPILEAESEIAQANLTADLASVIHAEVVRQEAQAAVETAWLLRQHLFEIAPNDLNNGLQLLLLALKGQLFSFNDERLEQITALLEEAAPISEPFLGELLLQVSAQLIALNLEDTRTLDFLDACIPHICNCQLSTSMIELLLNHANEYHRASKYKAAIQLSQRCIALAPNELTVLLNVRGFLEFGDVNCRLEALLLSEQAVELTTGLVDRIVVLNAYLANWISVGKDWQQAVEIYRDFKAAVQQFLDAQPQRNNAEVGSEDSTSFVETSVFVGSETDADFLPDLLSIGFPFFYLEDNPADLRPLRNQLAQIGQTCVRTLHAAHVEKYQQTAKPITRHVRTRPLKIGYLGATLHQHSVGWLCRWLMKYHDRDQFDVHLYSSTHSEDFVQQQFRQEYGECFHFAPASASETANLIYDNEIDILVELDSLTSTSACQVLSLKPAPIQVHWLGYDASGIPGVDYFIADPYVLPENAQNYYNETIWRLPQTYIAVDGFEVHIPSLRRDDLKLPTDAIVFLCSQSGMKLNAEHSRLQIQILKEVPNSYFLIKSSNANLEYIEHFFQQLAEEEGVNADRLKFLSSVPSELTHRANLALADVVLDTYPYNGATTTLEALWMGLPIVTHVGEQFAARNSYTMMMNAGVTEGIAWSNQEYLEWGVRLGTDKALRQDIFYRLQQSRHISPLWNGREFAREMERAYEQMWQQYLEK